MNDSTEDEPWPRPDLAERLLDGQEFTQEAQDAQDGAGSDPRITALARLLAAADGTPAGRAEDERAALRAFAAQFATASAPAGVRSGAPGRGLRRAIRGSRTAKVVIGGAAAAFALGGVAIAAQAGALGHPFGAGGATPVPGPSAVTSTRSPAPGSAPGTHGAPRPPATTTGPVRGTATPPVHTTSAPVVPGLKGLCESYLRAAAQGRALHSAAQARLARAAGGADAVEAYCAQVTGVTAVHGKPPKDRPTAAEPHATGAPATGSPTAETPVAKAPGAKSPEPRPSGHGHAPQARHVS